MLKNHLRLRTAPSQTKVGRSSALPYKGRQRTRHSRAGDRRNKDKLKNLCDDILTVPTCISKLKYSIRERLRPDEKAIRTRI